MTILINNPVLFLFMELKFAVFFVLGLLILGFLVALTAPGLIGLTQFAPTTEDISTQDLLNECNSKRSTYDISQNEETRKNYCCQALDLNGDGSITSGEYCATADNAQMICRTPIDYYTTYEACK